jgi:hypothetical protein
MDKPILSDEKIYPDDKVLTQHLGKTKNVWDSFLEMLKDDYPFVSVEWRYYNDGKSWLCKAMKKTKTFCWISVWKQFFKVTFYFNAKAEETIKNSALDDKIKIPWLKNEANSRFRPITIEVKKKTDLKTIKVLLELREKIK